TLVGRYLFLRQNNQQGCVEPGRAEAAAQLEGDWHREEEAGEPLGRLEGEGRVWVGLDLPEDLELALRLRASAAAPLVLAVNGVEVDTPAGGPEWSTLRVRLPRARWRRDLNVIALSAPATLWLRGLR